MSPPRIYYGPREKTYQKLNYFHKKLLRWQDQGVPLHKKLERLRRFSLIVRRKPGDNYSLSGKGILEYYIVKGGPPGLIETARKTSERKRAYMNNLTKWAQEWVELEHIKLQKEKGKVPLPRVGENRTRVIRKLRFYSNQIEKRLTLLKKTFLKLENLEESEKEMAHLLVKRLTEWKKIVQDTIQGIEKGYISLES